jgi:hypothetical protein
MSLMSLSLAGDKSVARDDIAIRLVTGWITMIGIWHPVLNARSQAGCGLMGWMLIKSRLVAGRMAIAR